MKALQFLFLGTVFSGLIAILNPNLNSSNTITNDRDPGYNIPMCKSSANFLFYDFTLNPNDPIAAKLSGLGDLHMKVTTDSREAQEFFDQGLRLLYSFNHEEAHRSFQEAARHDPNMAMAYWGQAYALGPNINDPFPDEERQKNGYESSQKALMLTDGITDLERDLIKALTHRYANKPMEQHDLNMAYFRQMKEVHKKHPKHPDVNVLYGASVMNTTPWNYYDENKEPRENISSCVKALKYAIDNYPNHPGGHHYYIHIIEAVDPEAALPSASMLGDMMPGAGHLVHMPAHIYLGTGRYYQAVTANRDAIKADEEYIAQCKEQGVYPLVYYPHNIHFLWAAASMIGRSEEAINAAVKVADKVPEEYAVNLAFIQDFLSVPYQAYVRFGKWNEILTSPAPPEELLHVNMMWHYARGMAYVRKGMVDAARNELKAVNEILADPSTAELLAAYNNPTSEVGKVASASLAAEIEEAAGNHDKAGEMYRKAVEAEDALVYQEPKAWHAPVRHYFGAFLMHQGQFAEAEAVYRKDLQINKHNGWSLFGLSQSLIAQGKSAEAAEACRQFEDAWQHADIALTSSRY